MSISAISSSNYLYELYVNRNSSGNSQAAGTFSQDKKSDPIKADLAQLWQALDSGNLTSAQSLFTQLQSDLEAIGSDAPVQGATDFASTDSTTSNPLANDLSALGSALDSEDIDSARQVLAKIMDHMRPPGGGPPPAGGNDEIAEELKSLAEALASGDITSAQGIFSQLQSDLEAVGNDSLLQGATASASTDSTASNNPLADDFSSLENALASNDVPKAKEYLLNILQHLQPGGLDMSSQLDIMT